MKNTEQQSHSWEQLSHSWGNNIHAMSGFLRDKENEVDGCNICQTVTRKGFEHCLSSGCFDRQIFGD